MKNEMPQYLKLRKEYYADYFQYMRKRVWKVYKWHDGFAHTSRENDFDLVDNRNNHFESATEEEYIQYKELLNKEPNVKESDTTKSD